MHFNNRFPFPLHHVFCMRYCALKNNVVHMFFLKKVLKKNFSKVTNGWLLQLLLFHIFLLKYFLWLFFNNKLSNHFRFISNFENTMTCVGVEVVIICWKNCKSTSSFLSNFLIISCCSKVLCSSSIGFCEANGSI